MEERIKKLEEKVEFWVNAQARLRGNLIDIQQEIEIIKKRIDHINTRLENKYKRRFTDDVIVDG